ncbi:MAG: HDIG domain-containing protein [Clostridia bacterium]|nr:HDIG domain-containing protein [Clostridia bacterium]
MAQPTQGQSQGGSGRPGATACPRAASRGASGSKSRVSAAIGAVFGSRLTIAFVAVAVAAVMVSWVLLPRAVELAPGQLAKRDIDAPRTVVNRVATDKLREDARKAYLRNAPSFSGNYEVNLSYSYMAEEAVDSVFAAVVSANANDPKASAQAVARAAQRLLTEAKGLSVSVDDLAILADLDRAQLDSVKSAAVSLAGDTMREIRITDSNLQAVSSGIPDDLARLGVLAVAIRPASRVVVAALRPNLSLNLAGVEKAADEQAKMVQAVYIHKGQSIIRRGDPATEEQIAILADLGLLGKRGNLLGWIGVVALCATAVAYTSAYIRRFTPRVPSAQGVLALSAVAGLVSLLSSAVLVSVVPDLAPYLAPAAFAAMVISSLVSLEMALVVNLSVAVLVGALMRGDMFAVLVAAAAGACGAYAIPRLRDRTSMTGAALYVGGAIAAVSFIYGSAFGEPAISSRWYLGFVNGIISTVMTLGFLPFFEAIFGAVSPLRLLELSNPGHPLLRRLLLEAPGTYHHSILVGNLAEAAAQAIGADALLVRVGALYHDCGKLKRPYFFAENQLAQANPHDKISPSLSTLIITSHAKDGADLAREFRLPEAVVDIAQQHHGTGLVSFFYYRATESDRDLCVDEKDFRYPGPKPQSREAAIVMLADSTEAAVRALPNPSQWRINNTVKKIVKDKLNDGQLDECELTLKDLNAMETAFMGVLSGVYHERVEYPDLVQKDSPKERQPEVKAVCADSQASQAEMVTEQAHSASGSEGGATPHVSGDS